MLQKLSEAELRELAAQLKCPDGDTGIKVGEMMNFTNNNIIAKTINSLALQNNYAVLEIGPGNGLHVKDIFAACTIKSYHGADISATMVAEAQRNTLGLANTSFVLSDGNSLRFQDAAFDKAFTVNTIYFWKNPEQYAAEIARVIKPGGLLAVGFIPKSTMEKIPFSKYGFRLYEVADVNSLLVKAGFKIVSHTAETEFVISNSGEKIAREIVISLAEKI